MSIEIREVASKKDFKTFILPAREAQRRPAVLGPSRPDGRLEILQPQEEQGLRLLRRRPCSWPSRTAGPSAGSWASSTTASTSTAAPRSPASATSSRSRTARSSRPWSTNVEDWAKAKGMTRIIGPYGFSDQDPEGFIIEGFENRATIATYYNFEWMPGYVEGLGYAKDADYFVYKLDVPKEMPELYKKIYERTMRRGNFQILEFRKRKELKPWIVPIFSSDERVLHGLQHLRLRPLEREGDGGPGRALPARRRPPLRQGRPQGRRAGLPSSSPCRT